MYFLTRIGRIAGARRAQPRFKSADDFTRAHGVPTRAGFATCGAVYTSSVYSTVFTRTDSYVVSVVVSLHGHACAPAVRIAAKMPKIVIRFMLKTCVITV